MAFLLSMEPVFKKFLCFFQNEGPLIHLLRYEIYEQLKSLMDHFLKRQVFKQTEGKHLLTVEYSKPDNLLSNSQLEGDENNCSALSKLTTDQQKVALTGTKQSFLCGDYKVPDQLLRDVFSYIQMSDIVSTSYS